MKITKSNFLLSGFFILIFFLFCGGASYADDLMVLTENDPPDTYACGSEVCGYAADLVKEIIARHGTKTKIQIWPWKRAYHYLSTKPNVVLFLTAYTLDRADKFMWVGPLGVNKYSLIRSRISKNPSPTLEEAKHLKIGTYANDVREKILIDIGFSPSNFTRLHGLNANTVNLTMLLSGRIELWATSLSTAKKVYVEMQKDCPVPSLCNRLEFLDAEDIFEPILDLQSHYLYAAFSMGTNPEIVKQWQKTLEQMKQDGTYEKIIMKDKNGKEYLTFDNPFKINN